MLMVLPGQKAEDGPDYAAQRQGRQDGGRIGKNAARRGEADQEAEAQDQHGVDYPPHPEAGYLAPKVLAKILSART